MSGILRAIGIAACLAATAVCAACAVTAGFAGQPAESPVVFTSRLHAREPAAPEGDASARQVVTSVCERRTTAAAAPVAGGSPIALTFDDGPSPGLTEQLLAVLASRGVRATFFMTGSGVERAPELARAVLRAGHVIGNHSYDHPEMDTLAPEQMDWEIGRTSDIIEQITGVRPAWMRPPYGRRANGVTEAIRRCGMRTAMWTLDPKDWVPSATPGQVSATVLAGARPGGIILLHERAGTVQALPDIIDGLQRAGYRLVTLDEL